MKKLLYLFVFLYGSLQGQSLLQDAQHLSDAVTVLTNSDAEAAAKAKALGQLTAILWFYDASRNQADQIPDLSKLLESYQNNNSINSLIEGLSLVSTDSSSLFLDAFESTKDSLESGPRNIILDLLYAEQAIDPADYLSLLKTVREYQEPPLSTIAALQAPVAAKSDEGAGGSLFNEEAIIRGLFSFLIERAGEELVVSFLDRLLGKEMPAVAKLFPTVITLYGTTDYAYSDSFLASLKDAFLQDLQLLDLRLPDLLLTDDLFAELQADPVFYSMLTVYTVVALNKEDGVPIEEVIPLVSRNLYKRYQDTEKQRNLLLADKGYTNANYKAVIDAVQAVIDQAKLIYADIEMVETTLNERALDFVLDGSIDVVLRKRLLNSSQIATRNDGRFAAIFKASGTDGYDLAFVPSLLSGQLPASLVATMGTLESYDKYFREPTTPQNRRAAGLALTRRLTGLEFGTQTLDQYFEDWRADLIDYNNTLLELEVAAKAQGNALSIRQNEFEQAKTMLSETIQAAQEQWKGKLDANEEGGLIVLGNILNNLDAIASMADSANVLDKLIIKEQDLAAVRERLSTLHTRIEKRLGKQALSPDPIALYENLSIDTTQLSGIESKNEELRARIKTLRLSLDALDANYAANLSRSHDNAKPLLQMGEVLSHLLYLLRTDAPDTATQRFVDIRQLQDLLLEPTTRQAFLGLVEQNLNETSSIGVFSRDGLSFLLQSTAQDLSLLPTRVKAVPDSLQFYQQSSFVVNTLNRLLETPLLIDPLQPDSVYALTNKWPGLARVPEISQNILDLIFYISTKNYRQAISKTLEAVIHFTDESKATFPDKKPGAQNGLLQFLHQYGGFIGGMVDADSASQVHALLEAFADPPGSSRVKRQQPFTAGLNAYVGGLIGRESLSGNEMASETSFNVFAPTIPVGCTFSFLVGNKYARKRPSFSVFFSIIDIGSLATYNLSEDLDGNNKLTFRNVLKPGMQLHWNIPKSPFYMGVGTQYGPHYREFDTKLLEQRSFRYFLTFGIDIVIKRFY